MFINIRVLIIEDYEDDLMLVLRELRRGGFEPEYIQIETAETMQQALAEQEWDVILSDYSLPSFSAPAALKVLKNSHNEIPFIVVSGNVGEEVAVQLMQYGCDDYVNKNNLSRLCPAIQRELEEFKNRKLHKKSQALTERLWHILNNSQNEIYVFDATTLLFKLLNQGALKNLGYTLDEMLVKHPYDIKPDLTESQFRKLIKPLVNEDVNSIHIETLHQRKNGTSYPAEVRLQLSKTDNESVFYAIVVDISDRVKANAEIESLAKFPQENPAPVIRLDNNLQLTYANPASQHIIDYWSDGHILKAPGHWQPLINKCLSNNEVTETEETIQDQIYHWLLAPSEDKSYVNCYARDITSQRLAEKDLRQAGQVFENSIEAIMITDSNNAIKRVNPAFEVITGYSEAEVLGETPDFLRSGEHNDQFYINMWESLNQDNRWQGEIWNRRKNGDIYPVYMTISVAKDEAQNVNDYIAIFADISERKKAQDHIHRLANYDALTDLPNRLSLQSTLSDYIKHAARHNNPIAVIYLDIDRFKTINEGFGHQVADQALKTIAHRISNIMPTGAIFGRMAGDEFLVLANNVTIDSENHPLINEIRNAIGEPLNLKNQDIYLSTSIGVSHYPSDADNMDNLIKFAETAVNYVKKENNGFQLFSNELDMHGIKHISLESGLRKALEREEYRLHYQPQIDLKSGKIVGLEALLRWEHPENGLVSPADFIPLLEQTGLIVQVGDWVLREACQQSLDWQKLGINVPRIAINLSAKQFVQKNFSDIIMDIISKSGVDPKFIELEVTESTIMHQFDQVISILRELHDNDIQISIDDFGTGYSSLSYLKHFPINVLKIDRSFVKEIPNDKDDIAIVNTIISMGHNLNLDVIAEGVETLEQSQCLLDMGCERAQGFYFSKPLPADDCLDYLNKHVVEKT